MADNLGNTAGLTALIIVLLVVAFAGGYYFYQQKDKDTVIEMDLGGEESSLEIDGPNVE